MATDFASEFRKVFSNSCPPQTDWNQPRYFDSLNSDCYASEAALLSSLTSEAYNKFGFEVYYFIKEHDTKFDPLLGEDQLENVKRRFALQVYTENVPLLQKEYQLQGMIYTETVTLQCTIAHFDEASRINFLTGEPEYESAIPKIGDLMYFKYCDLYYEVINVKKFSEGTSFLGTPINYTFIVRVWRNSHENVDELNINDDKMEHLRSYVELGETFNVEYNMDVHVNEEVNPYNPNQTSEVKAEGDVLSINNTVDWKNLEQSKNADAMDVLYNPNRDYDKVEKYLDKIDEVATEYSNAFEGIGEETQSITEETIVLQQNVKDLKQQSTEQIEREKHKFMDLDEELNGIDVESIQYTPKKS
jgi:hypothetical protein